MEENKARRVVDALRERGTDADLARVGVYQFGVTHQAARTGARPSGTPTAPPSLEAQVMRNGMLGRVRPRDRGLGQLHRGPDHRRDPAHRLRQADRHPAADGAAARAGPAPIKGGLFRRFMDGFRYR